MIDGLQDGMVVVSWLNVYMRAMLLVVWPPDLGVLGWRVLFTSAGRSACAIGHEMCGRLRRQGELINA